MKKTLILLLCGLLAVTSALAQGPRRPDTPLPKWEGLAQTPQMGWNSWNKFATNINEELIKATADKMVELGLVDAGYVYLNLDDGWHGERDEQGFIHEDPEKFPSGIKALADYMHAHGLKLGIYSDAGTNTCACYAGSLGHEYQDAFTYASWGIDYLKYDWCYTQNLNPHAQRPQEGRKAHSFQHLRMGFQQALGMGGRGGPLVAYNRRYRRTLHPCSCHL